MNNLSDEILLIIFSYVGPNTIYFNKGFLNYLNKFLLIQFLSDFKFVDICLYNLSYNYSSVSVFKLFSPNKLNEIYSLFIIL